MLYQSPKAKGWAKSASTYAIGAISDNLAYSIWLVSQPAHSGNQRIKSRFSKPLTVLLVIPIFDKMAIPAMAMKYQRPIRNLLQKWSRVLCQWMERETVYREEYELEPQQRQSKLYRRINTSPASGGILA
jgi:hypothetical protein